MFAIFIIIKFNELNFLDEKCSAKINGNDSRIIVINFRRYTELIICINFVYSVILKITIFEIMNLIF